ncbi:hypothetical protein DID73_00730 [Candidatus Marinamargulisbacteria bacterium SCGC AG-343-K17]|nr:hypothetical protein DID73_00730 [Candidatus Marinamargulisbacteria bacterium SCGC AG-343-K17]
MNKTIAIGKLCNYLKWLFCHCCPSNDSNLKNSKRPLLADPNIHTYTTEHPDSRPKIPDHSIKIKLIEGTRKDIKRALKECHFFQISHYDGIQLEKGEPDTFIASADIKNAKINLKYNQTNIEKGAYFRIKITEDFENEAFFVIFKILVVNRGSKSIAS